MKKLLVLFPIILLMTSCVTMKISDVNPEHRNTNLLPTLKPHVDVLSFQNSYASVPNSVIHVYPESVQDIIILGEVFEQTNYSGYDPRIQDAISIFIKDVKNNITTPYGDKKGDIMCRMTFGDTNSKGIGWAYLSAFTLFIPNLFGMPILRNRTTIELEVEIFNNDKKIIGRYRADCTNKKYVALYWGSIYPTAARRANATAFKCAMNKIKAQIDRDADRLRNELKK